MNYTTYTEQIQLIKEREYQFYTDILLDGTTMDQHFYPASDKKWIEPLTLRKLIYHSNKNPEKLSYQISMQDFNPSHIFLVERYICGKQIRKTFSRLTVSQCQQILLNDIEWMVKSDIRLFNSFYYQVHLNNLHPDSMTESIQERYPIQDKNKTYCFELSSRKLEADFAQFFERGLSYHETLKPFMVKLRIQNYQPLSPVLSDILKKQGDIPEVIPATC